MADKFVDIEKVIQGKSPTLLKWMPPFVLNYIKKILHEDDINTVIRNNGHLYGADFCDAVVDEFEITYEVIGKENIPLTGGCIFAANHPLGGMDAITTVSAMRDIRTDIKFIVNDILLYLDNLKGMFVGVNKVGKNRKASLRKVDETLASENAIFVFPAGLVSRKENGIIQDLPWKKTFITRAKKYDQPILPVFIDGKLTDFFYNLANLRTFFGINTNIEMFYLVNEFYKQRGIHIPIVFGELITPSQLTDEFTDEEWAEKIRYKTYRLKDRIGKKIEQQ